MQDSDLNEEDELIGRLRHGSHQAFETLYHRYKVLLVSQAYKRLGCIDTAKEIVQEIFTQMWINRTNIPEVRNISAWMYVLVRNKVLKHIAHQKVVDNYAENFRQFTSNFSNYTEYQLREREMQQIIDSEMEKLPPKMKTVLLMSRNQGLTHKMISEKLGISEHTVKNHIKAALKLLRTRLGQILFIII